MAKKSKKTKPKTNFRVGDFVVAKVKGHPHWPASIIRVPKPGKYEVKFFVTEETSSSFIDLKPFDATTRPGPNEKRAARVEAYEECRKQYEKVMKSAPSTSSPDASPKHLEIDNNREASPTEEDTKSSPRNDSVSPEPPSVSPVRDLTFDVECPNSIILNEIAPQLPESNGSIDLDHAPGRKSDSTPSIDCSLNDLTSERANADRGTKKSSPKLDETCKTNNAKTIEKLKKKLQKKLDEKEGKKKLRREKLEFESVEKVLPKFETKLNTLIMSGERFVANSIEPKSAEALCSSIRNCEKCLDQLSKCVIALSSDYGKTQSKSKSFHTFLSELVKCLKDIRDKNVKPISKDARRFLKELKSRGPIKGFINGFAEASRESKQELIVERKENARKRLKLSR
jgi:hypothetical protein